MSGGYIMEKFKNIVDFCHNHPFVICYGSAHHGHIIKHFLESQGIKIKAFIISSEILKGQICDGIPIYSVTDSNVLNIVGNGGIILGCREYHHADIKKILLSKCISNNVYDTSDQELFEMEKALLIFERNNTLLCSREFNDDELKKYDTQCENLFKKYKKVRCEFFHVRVMGTYAHWILKCHMADNEKNNCFSLLYPMVLENHPEQKLMGINRYLTELMSHDGVELLSYKNISFWQYVFKYYRDKCELIDEYYVNEWGPELLSNYMNVALNREYVNITEYDKAIGETQLVNMGIEGIYVCISNHESASIHYLQGNEINDLRDLYRNSDIRNYTYAIDYLRSKNIKTVRMGAITETNFDYPNVVDYANNYRTEFMDVYLTSKCKFFCADLSGILSLPIIFSKPMLILNVTLLTVKNDAYSFLSPSKDIGLLKKLWDKNKKKYMTLRDMLYSETRFTIGKKSGIASSVLPEYYRRGIVPIDNTPEEILAAVKEMNERIDGTVKYDALDIELQQRYREIVDNYPMKDNVLNNWRLGAAFLRENQWLLE